VIGCHMLLKCHWSDVLSAWGFRAGIRSFPQCQVKIMLWDFISKLEREETFRRTLGITVYLNVLLLTVLRVVNFATSKGLLVKITMFSHWNIQKHTWILSWLEDSQSDWTRFDRIWHSSLLHVRSFRRADCDSDDYVGLIKLGRDCQ
jgi:hypothetical protein